MVNKSVRRKVFISHYGRDHNEVEAFVGEFANYHRVFTPFVLGANDNDDFIDSDNTAHMMEQLRKNYLKDSTVTIVLLGTCTHSRRHIDWELKSSLAHGEYSPNGVIGIVLRNQGTSCPLPPRLKANWVENNFNCYARVWEYPSSPHELRGWIEDAHTARTERAHLIRNSQNLMTHNAKCDIHLVTH